MSHNKLFEGLQKGDLRDCVESLFTVDQYTSKMGEDKNTVVLRFRVKDKFPAIDMMEFIEKGYPFVLDADVSSGEERDGKYSVFVELERNKKIPETIQTLLSGISKLTDNTDWKFRYYKDVAVNDFSEESILEHIPLTPEEYDQKLNEMNSSEVNEFFNESSLESIDVDKDLNITFNKAFVESLKLKLVCIGDYTEVKDSIKGGIQLDEASNSETLFLNKYLGNYDINKINGQFLIRNGDRAAVVKFL